MNSLVKNHVSIVSSKRGSTYENTVGVYSHLDQLKQIHFTDTIGINSTDSLSLNTKGLQVMQESDLILLVIDGSQS